MWNDGWPGCSVPQASVTSLLKWQDAKAEGLDVEMLHPPGFLFFCAGAGGWWPWWPEVEKRLLPSLSVAGGGPFCSSFRCFVHCQEVGAYLLMHIQFFVTPWTVAHQAPLSVGFSSKNTGVGCHALLQGIFPTQGSSHISRGGGRQLLSNTQPQAKAWPCGIKVVCLYGWVLSVILRWHSRNHCLGTHLSTNNFILGVNLNRFLFSFLFLSDRRVKTSLNHTGFCWTAQHSSEVKLADVSIRWQESVSQERGPGGRGEGGERRRRATGRESEMTLHALLRVSDSHTPVLLGFWMWREEKTKTENKKTPHRLLG